jgi:hypothetical protein
MCAHAYITCGVTNEPRIRANVCVCSRTPSRPSQHACFRRAAGSDGWAHGASACSVHANARASSLRRPARKQKARRRRGARWRRSVDRENGISRTRDGTRISPRAGLTDDVQIRRATYVAVPGACPLVDVGAALGSGRTRKRASARAPRDRDDRNVAEAIARVRRVSTGAWRSS